MTLKMTGAEFKRFYADPSIWGEDTFHDDVLILVDGVNASDADIDLSQLPDSAKVDVASGEILEGMPGVPEDLVEAVQWWRERQVSVECVVTVPKEQMAAFEAALAGVGLLGAVNWLK